MQLSRALASFLDSVLALGGLVLCVGSCCDESKLVCEPQSKWHRQGSLLLPLPPSSGRWAVGAVSPTRKPGLVAGWPPGQSAGWEPAGPASRAVGDCRAKESISQDPGLWKPTETPSPRHPGQAR